MNKTKIVIAYFLLLASLVLVLTLPSVKASGFSPGSLVFELEQNQKACQTITVESTSQTINVSDSWAENKDINWSVSLFNESASYHGISINYDKELSSNERQVEICLSGSTVGEYHGVILLKEAQEGNSIIQMAVWLKVTITEPPAASSSSSGGGGSSGSGGGSNGGGTSYSVTNNNNNNVTVVNNNVNTVNGNAVPNGSNETNKKGTENKIGITGSIVNEISKPSTIGIGVGILLIGAVFVYNRKKIKKKFRRGE